MTPQESEPRLARGGSAGFAIPGALFPAGARGASLLNVFIFLLPLFAPAAQRGPLPAFPGAEGFGSTTPGGRGGRVIAVTTLNPSGPGSIQEACQARGPRIVVFRVGGVLQLTRSLEVREPFLTLAGQTAPGDGICLRGAGLSIRTHDVIIRGLRLRVGDDPGGPDPENRDGIEIAHNKPGEVYNIVVDHCSVSWAIDENVSTWYECRDITFQWCLIAEALMKGSSGFDVGLGG